MGQLQTDTMGRPGLLGLWILGKKKIYKVLGVVMVRNLSLLIECRHFLMEKSRDANWPSGGVHLDFRI